MLITKRSLVDALANLERVIPTRSSNLALTLLHLTLSNDTLTLEGTNTEIDLRATLKADVSESGRYAVPAGTFGQIVRAAPGELIELDFKAEEVSITSGKFSAKVTQAEPVLVLRNTDAYPHGLDAPDLRQALSTAISFMLLLADDP